MHATTLTNKSNEVHFEDAMSVSFDQNCLHFTFKGTRAHSFGSESTYLKI